MDGIKHTAKIREYCDYIDEHLRNVAIAWAVLQRKCKSMHFVYDDWVWAHIDQLVKEHDISKMSMEEFIPYQRKFFPADKEVIKGERKEAFEKAWQHHQDHNPHHWQEWTREGRENGHQEQTMHCACMVIDWMAMSIKFGGSAEDYYRREERKGKIQLPVWAKRFLDEIFEQLRKGD